MRKYRCPVCNKPLTQREYESVLRIEKAKIKRLREREQELHRRERELPKKIVAAASAAQQKEKKRAERLMAGQRQTIKRLEVRIGQLEKGSTPQTEGLEFEDRLAARLKHEFPDDDIKQVGTGGDVLQTVRSAHQRAGLIVYECKRTRHLSAKHVEQARRAKHQRGADFVVLVTTAASRRFTGLQVRDGVMIVAPLGAAALAGLLRELLIEMLKSRLSRADRVRAAERLAEYIASPRFKNPIEEVVNRSLLLQGLLRGEAKNHLSVWRKRWEHYQRIHWDGTQIRQNVRLVLQGKEPRASMPPKVASLALAEFARERH